MLNYWFINYLIIFFCSIYSYTGALTDSPNSVCAEISYKLATSTNDYRLRYVIICPIDKGLTTIATTTNANKITFTKFALPFYVGAKTDYFKNILGYGFSNRIGIPMIYTY